MNNRPIKTVTKLKSPVIPVATPTTTTTVQKIPREFLIKSLSKGPRPSCQDCARKHIAQAVVLLSESLLGYPEHKWLAIGHLAEASEECLEEFPEIAQAIRQARLELMEDVIPDLMMYLRDDFAIILQDSQ